MKRLNLYSLAFLTVLPACGGLEMAPLEDGEEPVGEEIDWDPDGKVDTWSTALSEDNLNGLWNVTVDGQKLPEGAVIESWPAIGIRINLQGAVHRVTRNVTTLTGEGVSLTLAANNKGVADDAIEGTLGGKAVRFTRDTASKKPIVLDLPADRPYRSFLNELLVPAAQRDRESYFVMRSSTLNTWLNGCELYKKGVWPRQYMKGATLSEQYANFRKIIYAMDGQKTSPHALIHNARFVNTINENIKDPTKAGLIVSTLTMYFSTAGGGSVRLPLAPDSMAYFITDRPSRASKIGLVAMTTPTHATLASTFGRQLLDLAAMAPGDDSLYTRAMMEILAKSDKRLVSQLSPFGKSAITDWFAVMAIEDYRGVAFGNPSLGWGYNMTNVQFYGLVTRALGGQVIVGNELRPGDASYADVLNAGNDMREYPDMARLKTLATSFLREKHPVEVRAVEAAFAEIVPAAELDWRAQSDLFHFITAQLYDNQNRTARLTGSRADDAVNAVTALVDVLKSDAAAFEAYILAAGVVKSSVPAPKSTGF